MSRLLEHEVAVDWSGGGTFEGNGTVGAAIAYTVGQTYGMTVADAGAIVSPENVSARVLLEPPGSAERGRDDIGRGSRPLANEFLCTIDNRSGDYSPGRAGSPLYPNVDVGRAVRWRITAGATTYDAVRATLTAIVPDASWEAQHVRLTALSQLARLVNKSGYSSALFGDGTTANGLRTDEAFALVLDVAGLTDPGLRALDVGETTLLWFVIRPGDELFDLALRILATEGWGARLFDAAAGPTTFKRRNAQVAEPVSTDVQATFKDTDDGVNPWFSDWQRDPDGERTVVNRCTLTHLRRAVDAADAVLWQFGEDVVLAAGESRSFPVWPTIDEPIYSVAVPAAGTDYTVSSGALAGAPVFDRTSGPFVTMTLTGGGAGATVRGPTGDEAAGIRVQGKLARVTARTEVVSQVDASASIARHGPQPYALPALGEIDYGAAQALVDTYVSREQTPRVTGHLTVPLVSEALAHAVLGLEVGHRIAVISEREAYEGTMHVESMRLAWDEGGVVTAVLGVAEILPVDSLLWDSGVWDSDTWAA